MTEQVAQYNKYTMHLHKIQLSFVRYLNTLEKIPVTNNQQKMTEYSRKIKTEALSSDQLKSTQTNKEYDIYAKEESQTINY